MPIYMDRHDIPGATATDLATAHRKDLEVQEEYGCRALTYWFDGNRGVAFCLVDAPDAEAVTQMHNAAHGMVPNRIIAVSEELVGAFLGRLGDPPETLKSDSSQLRVFENSAFRIVLATELKEGGVITMKYGSAAGRTLFEFHDQVINRAFERHNGGPASKSDNSYLTTFASASDAVECAKQIHSELNAGTWAAHIPHAADLHVGIGLSAGDPVTDGNELFGEAIQVAKQLCRLVRGNQVLVTAAAGNEFRKEKSTPLVSHDSFTILDPSEERFLIALLALAEESWNDATIHVEDLSRQVGRSKSQLSRKLVTLTGHTPKEFVRDFRLRKALELLLARSGNVSEIAFRAGFNSAAYFSKCFQNRFGVLPSAYVKLVS